MIRTDEIKGPRGPDNVVLVFQAIIKCASILIILREVNARMLYMKFHQNPTIGSQEEFVKRFYVS